MTTHVYFSSHARPIFSKGWWIALASQSPITHVSFGDDSVVVHLSYNGVRFWPRIAFETKFPGLACKYEFDGEPNLSRYEKYVGVKQSMVRRAMRWITRGAHPMMDCTAMTSEALASIGIDIPRHVVTPIQMMRWFRMKGHQCLPI